MMENVNLISFAEYCELFGISETFIQKCDSQLGFDSETTIDDAISGIIGNVPPARDLYMEMLLGISKRAKFLLDNWNQKLLQELV